METRRKARLGLGDQPHGRVGGDEGYAYGTSASGGEPSTVVSTSIRTTGSTSSAWMVRRRWRARVAGPIAVGIGSRCNLRPDHRDGGVPLARAGHLKDRGRVRTLAERGYLARITASPSGGRAYIVFVVREAKRRSALLFQSSVTTYAAYNKLGGRSLYAFNSGGVSVQGLVRSPVRDEPSGAARRRGRFLRSWEYKHAALARQREGHDVAYLTDVDTHARADLCADNRIFISVGHDEYWSWAHAREVDAARGPGSQLGDPGAKRVLMEHPLRAGRRRAQAARWGVQGCGATDPVAADTSEA